MCPTAVAWADKAHGSDVNQHFVTDAGAPHGVAIHGEHIYWTAAAPWSRERTSTPARRAQRRRALHTVLLPRFGAEALTALVAESGMDGPVFANRTGAWMSLANMRRSLRAALPADLSWMTPHSLRRTVATVVRDARGPAQAQQQLSHAKLATTEAHYLQRQTRGPDVRAVPDKYADGDSGD